MRTSDIVGLREIASEPDTSYYQRTFRTYEGKFRRYRKELEDKIRAGDLDKARVYYEKFRYTIQVAPDLSKIDSATKRLRQEGPLYVRDIQNFPDIQVSKVPQQGYEAILPEHKEAIENLIDFHQKRAVEAARLIWLEEH
jgi:hypothetical protein